MATLLSGKPASNVPELHAVCAVVPMLPSSATASERLAIAGGGTKTHAPSRSCSPGGHWVHWPMPVHSTQLESHAVHCPLLVEPNWPLGQKVVQLVPSRKGAPELAGQAVQASASPGAEHAAHAWWQGMQKPVALGEKPAGHAARHEPRCISGAALLASQAVQLDASGPSHVAHEASHVPHVAALVTNVPAPQRSRE